MPFVSPPISAARSLARLSQQLPAADVDVVAPPIPPILCSMQRDLSVALGGEWVFGFSLGALGTVFLLMGEGMGRAERRPEGNPKDPLFVGRWVLFRASVRGGV